jgi:NAD-dependent deacetylase
VGERGSIDAVRGWVGAARRVVVLTGAGISTDSGIPDFRGPQGIWTKNPGAERRAHISHYLADPAVRAQVWQSRADSPAWRAQPNAGHRAIVALERQGRLHTLVTQNIDGLHQLAGNNPALVVELHGTMREVVCLDCGDRGPAAPTLDRVRAGEADPECLRCGGILKAATVSFGQPIPSAVWDAAERMTADCDAFVAVGSSLIVQPAARLPVQAKRLGASLLIVNREPTPLDDLADAVLHGEAGTLLPALVDRALAATPR